MTSLLQELSDPGLDEYLIQPGQFLFDDLECTPNVVDVLDTPIMQSPAWQEMLRVAGVEPFDNKEQDLLDFDNANLKSETPFPPSSPHPPTLECSLDLAIPRENLSVSSSLGPSVDLDVDLGTDFMALESPPYVHTGPLDIIGLSQVMNSSPASQFATPLPSRGDSCSLTIQYSPNDRCEPPFEPFVYAIHPDESSDCHPYTCQCNHCATTWPQEITGLVASWKKKQLPYSVMARYISDIRGISTPARVVRARYQTTKSRTGKQTQRVKGPTFMHQTGWTREADAYLVSLRDNERERWAEIAQKVSKFRGRPIGVSTVFYRYWKCKSGVTYSTPTVKIAQVPAKPSSFRCKPFKKFVLVKSI